MSRIEILTIGDELVEGRLTDTNAGELSAKLVDLGLAPARHATVADDMGEMVAALREAAARSDAVLVSGGLGPTTDDLTAEAAARAFQREIVRFDEALAHARHFFAERGREMPASNEKQADLPTGSTILSNPEGTAVGFRLDAGSCRLYFMPGVPRELRRMTDESVLPDLETRIATTRPQVATLKLFGIGESDVAQRLEAIDELVPSGVGFTVQYRATFPEIHLRLVVAADNAEAGDAALHDLRAEVQQRLDRYVFATGGATLDTDFPAAVAETAGAAGLTIAAAEVASGGDAARLLGGSETGRQVFAGGVVAADAAQLARQLECGEITAEATAEAVRQRFGASIGIAALGSHDGRHGGRAGEILVAAAGPEGVAGRELFFPIDPDRFRRLAAYAALGILWRRLGPFD
ncbi:MAG: molybdopterin-binding protein [Thermoanaerobaculales bacterium]|nr:molybdopterin-binding protein [Thermoanaerobaculales bacterium]